MKISKKIKKKSKPPKKNQNKISKNTPPPKKNNNKKSPPKKVSKMFPKKFTYLLMATPKACLRERD